MKQRHAAVNCQIAALQLEVHDVAGDGNCLFRAINYALYNDESKHEELRSAALDYICNNKEKLRDKFCLIWKELNSIMEQLSRSGESADEHAIYVLPDILNRKIIVHVAFAIPQTFSPAVSISSRPPISIAFYDGLCGGVGHYKAVLLHDELRVNDLNF